MAQENPAPSLDAVSRRQWRSNTICETLAGLGHTVVRWRSSFSHQQKKQLSDASIAVPSSNYLLQYIKAPSYKNHVGLARIRSHMALASNFLSLANEYKELPDLIHVGNVPIELCAAAVSFGRSNGIPVVVDIRDLWPDTYIDLMPSCLSLFRPVFLWLIRSFSFRARFCYKNATAINGLTPSFLRWGLDWTERQQTTKDAVFCMAYPKVTNPPSEEDKVALRTRLGVGSHNILSCYFGNIGYQSDFDTIIEAACILETVLPSFRFIIAGTGPKLESLKRKTMQLGNIILPGWLSGAEISTLMQLSVIGYIPYLPIPNYLKNIPNKFPEYLAGQLAIACGLQGEMGNLVQETGCGFVYSSGNGKILASNLIRILSQPDILNTMRLNAKNLHRGRFDSAFLYPIIAEYLVNLAYQNSFLPGNN